MADDTGRNLEAQVEMYGEPLSRVFGRVVDQLGLTRAALARTLGMSPAMLSHLTSGTRVKIGNPAVQRRLEEVRALADAVGVGEVTGDDIQERLDSIRESTGSWTATRHDAPAAPVGDPDVTEAATVRSLLRAVSSGTELQEAADLLQAEHAGLAEVVRTYGLGSSESATDHLRRHRPQF